MAKPSFCRGIPITDGLAGVQCKVQTLTLSRPINVGCTVKELSKLHMYDHGLLIEYGPICHVKLLISIIRPFSLVNNSHITLYPKLEIIWKVSKSLRKYWGKISFYIISCVTRDCIIVKNIFLV